MMMMMMISIFEMIIVRHFAMFVAVVVLIFHCCFFTLNHKTTTVTFQYRRNSVQYMISKLPTKFTTSHSLNLSILITPDSLTWYIFSTVYSRYWNLLRVVIPRCLVVLQQVADSMTPRRLLQIAGWVDLQPFLKKSFHGSVLGHVFLYKLVVYIISRYPLFKCEE